MKCYDSEFSKKTNHEIDDLLNDDRSDKEFLTTCIIDSYSLKTFLNYVSYDYFAYYAITYLAHHVHQETRDYFIDKLTNSGNKNFVDDLFKEIVNKPQNEEISIFVICDSIVRLSVLTGGLDSEKYIIFPFDSWDSAIELTGYMTPDYIITDTIIGLELSLPKLSLLPENDKIVQVIMVDDFKNQYPFVEKFKHQKKSFNIDKVLNYPLDVGDLKKYLELKLN